MFEEARPWQPRRPLRAVGTGPSGAPDMGLMELAASLGGEPGNEYPECVHPTLGAVARGVYAHCAVDARPALLRLAPSLVGTACTGLDVSARLVATCVSTALASPLPERIDADRSRRLEAAGRTACYLMSRPDGEPEQKPRATTRTWLHALGPLGLAEPLYRRLVAPVAAAEAVVVVAGASGDARDDRLSQLLRWCIDLTRRLVGDRPTGERGQPRPRGG